MEAEMRDHGMFSSASSRGRHSLWNDQRGTIAIITGLCATALVGFMALAIDVASWQVAQRSMQGAADAAAYSAGIAYNKIDGSSITTQAKGVAAAQGYVDGQNGVTVGVHQPPIAPSTHTSSSTAIQVIIQQPQPRFFAGLFLSSNPTVSASAVVTLTNPSCILALDTTASAAVSVGGSSSINSKCDIASNSTSTSAISMGGSSTVTAPCLVAVGTASTTSGLTLTQCTSPTNHAAATPDPYASVPAPTASGSCLTPVSSGNNVTFSPGKYCGSIQLSGSQAATFQPGVYYVDGNFKFTGSASATGTGVTFYITSPNSVDFGGNRNISFSAPTSGTYSGIVFFGDRAGTASNQNIINGGSSSSITGAIYFPTESVTFSGGTASGNNCTQIVADKVTVTGNSYFRDDCIGSGLADLPTVRVVE
jgi:hypothetical protein